MHQHAIEYLLQTHLDSKTPAEHGTQTNFPFRILAFIYVEIITCTLLRETGPPLIAVMVYKRFHRLYVAAFNRKQALRYAIYFTPPIDDALTQCGADWLGRDAFRNLDIETASHRAELVTTPARYGFHATLKAPFHLAPEAKIADLHAAFVSYCRETAAIELPELSVIYTGNSFVLGLNTQSDALNTLAFDVVRRFDPWRAELNATDIARRKPDQLSERQREHLQRWGYPHVMDDFRFHMTLTGPVTPDKKEATEQRIREHFSAHIGKPLLMFGLGLFVEPARGEKLHVADWQRLKG